MTGFNISPIFHPFDPNDYSLLPQKFLRPNNMEQKEISTLNSPFKERFFLIILNLYEDFNYRRRRTIRK